VNCDQIGPQETEKIIVATLQSTAIKTVIGVLAALCVGVVPALGDDNPFRDVPPSDPAYQAVMRLYEAGYLKGYPNGYFDGKRPITRYEMAVLIDRVTTEMENELRAPASAGHVSPRDAADAKLLLDQYGTDIKDLKARETALETVTSSLAATLDRAQIHLYYYLRAPGTYTETVNAFQPNGTPIPASTAISDGVSNYVTGTNARGTGIQVLRLSFSGNFDKQTSYGIRLENKNFFGQANVNGFDNINPSINTYNDQGVLRINYAFVRYQFTSSPLYVVGGKYRMAEN
jgi:hypothetical protein